MPQLSDKMIPILRSRMMKLKNNPEPDPVKTERALMNLSGEVMEKLVRGHFQKDLIELPNCRAALLTPKKKTVRGTVLYLHGGGYCTGDLDYACWFGKLISQGVEARTFCPAYRLAPEHPFPAALEDAADAYNWLLKAFPGEPVTLIGESAGGGLLLALCLYAKEKGLPQPAGLVALSPWTDLTQSGASYIFNLEADPSMTREKLEIFARAYTDTPLDPLCSPLFGDLAGLPECLIFAGGDEVMLSDSLQLAAALKKAGCPCELTVAEGLWHAYVFYGFKSRHRDTERITEFLRGKMS